MKMFVKWCNIIAPYLILAAIFFWILPVFKLYIKAIIYNTSITCAISACACVILALFCMLVVTIYQDINKEE